MGEEESMKKRYWTLGACTLYAETHCVSDLAYGSRKKCREVAKRIGFSIGLDGVFLQAELVSADCDHRHYLRVWARELIRRGQWQSRKGRQRRFARGVDMHTAP